ncbi:UNVERIFIED_CONTAM: hypothetical protein FKN15_024226 [Acipenser sinensis]
MVQVYYRYILLDGNNLTSTDLVNLGKGLYMIKLTPEAEKKVGQSRALIENIVTENKVVYGITTGFGKFAQTVIPNSKLNFLPLLAPLSHLALGLMGEGKMWSPKSGWADAKYVLEAHGLKPISLKPKEGLALINGTQMITSLGSEAVERALAIARQADIIAALTLEVLKGTTKAFDSDIHELRPHPGQKEVAFRFRSLLDSDHHPSEIAESHRFCDRVQDAYTLRCCPQVHGVVNDTIAFAKNIIDTEINSATDNPFQRIKCCATPSSVDSLSTSAATEDHVSMGGWAARKALKVIEHVEQGRTMPTVHSVYTVQI